jgi:hypothetical protein
VARPRTNTICCGAVALFVLLGDWCAAQTPPTAAAAEVAGGSTLATPYLLRPLWSTELPAPAAAPAAFDATHAYVPLRNGRLVAIDLLTGQTAWSIELTTTISPACGDGLVYVSSEDTTAALEPLDGKIRWRASFAGAKYTSLTWEAGWLIAGTSAAEIVKFRARDGHVIWRVPAGSILRSSPAVDADVLYAPLEDGQVAALSLETGEKLWDRRFRGKATEILVFNHRLFLGSEDNFFYCLKTKDGSLIWRWRTGADVVGRPVTDESRVYFLSLDNLLRALDVKHGKQLWKRALPRRPRFGPVQLDDVLIVAGIAPQVDAFRADEDGSPAGTLVAAGELAMRPHPALYAPPLSNGLVLLTRDGRLQAFAGSIDPAVAPLSDLPGTLLGPEILSAIAELTSREPRAAPPFRREAPL